MENNEELGAHAGADNYGAWLTVQEAVAYCHDRGLSRTAKTVRKWAQAADRAEEGHGDIAVKHQDTENGFRYLIERVSLDIKVQQEQEFEQRSEVHTGVHTSTPVESGAYQAEVATEEVEEKEAGELIELRSEHQKAQEKILNLKIDNRAKEQFIAQMVKEREGFIDRLTNQSRQVGILETKLLQLGAPEYLDHSSHQQNVFPQPDNENNGV